MNIIEQTRAAIRELLEAALKHIIVDPDMTVPPYVIEMPKEHAHGDFSTNLAMQLTRLLRKNPKSIAEEIVAHLPEASWMDKVEIAGPGFINFYLQENWCVPVLAAVQQEDTAYGRSDFGAGEQVQVEFVSANPTGLLHMGNARGGALGESLAAVLDAAGFKSQKEYYINDAGSQVKNLARSVEARYFELLGIPGYAIPEDGYRGEDIIATAQRLRQAEGDHLGDLPQEERLAIMQRFALDEKVQAIREGLGKFGVTYDRWFSEQSLHASHAIDAVVSELQTRGFLDEHDGALWLRCTAFGAEKDEVLIRSNGEPTYFAADIAYHKDKFDRGYTKLINIWGADHHGHVARLKGAMTALGYDGDAITVILMQLVRLYRDGEPVKMSKRKGQYVTLEELIEEVGRDAARFFFVMRSPDSPMDFDLDLAKSQSSENPVYYVQYAHARICSILSVTGVTTPQASRVDLSLLNTEAERQLIRRIADWPQEVADAARDLAPYRLAYYAKDLATDFHSFYNHCKVLTDDIPLRDARLVLVDAARITLRNVLNLLGIEAPERM